MEFQALFEVKQALRKIFNEIEDTKKKQSEINKELAKVNTTEGDVIKTGLFGKAVSKAELSKELTDKVNHTTEELDALSKLRGVIFNILYYREFPRIIVDLRVTLGQQEQGDGQDYQSLSGEEKEYYSG